MLVRDQWSARDTCKHCAQQASLELVGVEEICTADDRARPNQRTYVDSAFTIQDRVTEAPVTDQLLERARMSRYQEMSGEAGRIKRPGELHCDTFSSPAQQAVDQDDDSPRLVSFHRAIQGTRQPGPDPSPCEGERVTPSRSHRVQPGFRAFVFATRRDDANVVTVARTTSDHGWDSPRRR